ncbi:endonuclease Q family protein [Desulfitobacterium sp.]|uniref:endonuclease Q family protein n=1 Tax=Desulfitobacterium sp. TaxID=49981 RepID=UPI002C746D6B|nr:endonuclease Q family protein [Desulfitobacterium sp.]HVJ48416.1 endonuclease Q family protein [Desulfitobacterium sp.]
MIKAFADLHIHIGQSLDGKAVKITAARSLTLPNILHASREVKGLSMIGVIDAHSRGVRQDFRTLLRDGQLKPLEGGGYQFGNLTVIPGIEQELSVGEGNAHFLAYFPTLEHLERYISEIKPQVKNWQLSSQKAHVLVEEWLGAVALGEGIWLPAHAFTPHKGIYGNCCKSLLDVLPGLPPALEIGLSADRQMARSLSELEQVTLFSNSDAHSLPKIAREYNLLELTENSFSGLSQLVYDKKGQVVANYGLPPKVGKYHRTYCLVCEKVVEGEPPLLSCPRCGSRKVVTGVMDRLTSIADRKLVLAPDPRYIYQVPLQDLPGIGPKMYSRLLEAFGTEMTVIHQASEKELVKVAGKKVAQWILSSRAGTLTFQAGGGGIYGRVVDILS